MKYHSQDLLTLLISLFIFSSCTNPSLVGLDIDERDQIQGQYTDTVTVQSATFKEGAVVTSGSALTPLGFLKDPMIGESSASIAFALAPLTSGDSRLPANITIDSAVLVMNYGNEFFGDTLGASVYHIEVNQLKEPYKFGNQYASDQTWEVEPATIGQKTIPRFAYRDSVVIGNQIDGKDTVLRVGPQLRIPMDIPTLENLFASNLDSATFADDENFHARVKGFYVQVNQEAQEGDGGIVQMAFSNEANGIEVYYKLPDSTSQSVRRYGISSGQASTAITHTYTEAVENALASTDKDQATIFIQGLAGLGGVIQFPYLETLKDQGLLINKAELIVTVDEETRGTAFNYQAPRLTLYQKDIAGQIMPIPDGDMRRNGNRSIADPRSFGLGFGGFYKKDSKSYHFALTSYIQDILLGKTKNKEIYLIPSAAQNLTTVPYMPDFRTSTSAILGGGNNPGKYKMKLNLYVSKIDE